MALRRGHLELGGHGLTARSRSVAPDERAARRFDELLDEAAAHPLSGFDFSFLDGRVDEQPLPWDYLDVVHGHLGWPLLDMGTGGGEVFSRLAPFAGTTVATEAWLPNVAIAAERLHPLGAWVVQVEPAPDNGAWTGDGGRLPFRDAAFGLVVNRHEAFSPTEVWRVLRPGGVLVTQQVGPDDDAELHALFGSATGVALGLDGYVEQLGGAGLEVVDAREASVGKVFTDVGAVAWYLQALSWEFPRFSSAGSRDALLDIDRRIRARGGFEVRAHRLLVVARRPAGARAGGPSPIGALRIRRLVDLGELDGLVDEAEREGYGFVARLARRWLDGTNRFDAPGEAIFVAEVQGAVVGVGGLNADPYTEAAVGRLRHLYVIPAARRRGVATALVDAIVSSASATFSILRLRTDRRPAVALYEALGFSPVEGDEFCTHVLALPRS